MAAQEIVQVIQAIGIPASIIFFIGYLLYRYMVIRFEQMREQLKRELLLKKYNVKGTVHQDSDSSHYLIDVEVNELDSN